MKTQANIQNIFIIFKKNRNLLQNSTNLIAESP